MHLFRNNSLQKTQAFSSLLLLYRSSKRGFKQNQYEKNFIRRFESKLHELERQALDTQARQEGYNTKVRLVIIGGREYSNTLDKEISTERTGKSSHR